MPQSNTNALLRANIQGRQAALQKMSEAMGDLEFRYSLGPFSNLARVGMHFSSPEQFKVGKPATDDLGNPLMSLEEVEKRAPHKIPRYQAFHIPQTSVWETPEGKKELAAASEEIGKPIQPGDIAASYYYLDRSQDIWPHEIRHKGSSKFRAHGGMAPTPKEMFPTYDSHTAEELVQRTYDALKGDPEGWKFIEQRAPYLVQKFGTQEKFIEHHRAYVEALEQKAEEFLKALKGLPWNYDIPDEEWVKVQPKWR